MGKEEEGEEEREEERERERFIFQVMKLVYNYTNKSSLVFKHRIAQPGLLVLVFASLFNSLCI